MCRSTGFRDAWVMRRRRLVPVIVGVVGVGGGWVVVDDVAEGEDDGATPGRG